ncbi:MAG: hypothetical protein M1835_004443 [Candelina submexicana]|nr:MAG: hypothetical protein M1835_004443 [Candelina submexicana]
MSELKRKRCSDDELDSTKRIRLNTQGPSCYKGNEIGLQKRPIELIEEHSEAKQVRSMEPRKAVLSTFEPVELKNTQATALPQYRTDEEMCQYYIHCYKHLALDITEPPAPNKSKKAGTSHNNSDEAIASEEEEDDGEERIETTCLTWQSAVESTMDELKRLIRMSDKPLKVPKDYLCAAEQFRAFKEFQQDTEALMLRFRHALDKTRYTADGSLREELVDDDRELYWDPFKGEKEFVERFGQEPPMIPVPNHSGYFREEEEPIVIYKPPETPLVAPKPQNTPISNICLESGQLCPDLIASKTTAVASSTFNSRTPNENFYNALSPNHNSKNTGSKIIDDKHNEEVAEEISDPSRTGSSSTSSTSDGNGSDADTGTSVSDECDDADVEVERKKSEHGCCWVRLKPDGSIDSGSPEKTEKSERDKMSDRTQDFCRTLLQYERNKHAIENWSDADCRKERTEYVRSALDMVEASLKGTLEELPKWRPDLTDYQHDQLIFEEGPGDNEVGAIEAITELKCRLNGAELLLKRSAMNKRWEGSGSYV